MAYKRKTYTDNLSKWKKEDVDNLQDGIDEVKKDITEQNNNLVSKVSGVTNNIESTNNFKETVTGIKDVAGFSATSFADANFVAQAESAGNVCGYGFHIPSTIGGYIFMNGDGNLFFTNSNGKTYKINMTPTE